MDTRMEHREYLFEIATTVLFDPNLAEQMGKSLALGTSAFEGQWQVWYAKYSGNEAQLKQLLISPIDPGAKLQDFEYLSKEKGVDSGCIVTGYKKLIKENPDNLNVRFAYSSHLERNKKYSDARRVLRDWLKRKVVTLGLDDVVTRARIARLYYKEGLYRKGWAVIKPAISSNQGDVLDIAAMLLEKMGSRKDAEKMARFLSGNYPDSLFSSMALVKIYWLHGRYDDAAKVLKRFRINVIGWRFEIGKAFRRNIRRQTGPGAQGLLFLGCPWFRPGEPEQHCASSRRQ